jgi:hypothetical protein
MRHPLDRVIQTRIIVQKKKKKKLALKFENEIKIGDRIVIFEPMKKLGIGTNTKCQCRPCYYARLRLARFARQSEKNDRNNK